MKFRELASIMPLDTEFCIKVKGLNGSGIFWMDGDILTNYAEFDCLLDKEVQEAGINRDNIGVFDVTVCLQEREEEMGRKENE